MYYVVIQQESTQPHKRNDKKDLNQSQKPLNWLNNKKVLAEKQREHNADYCGQANYRKQAGDDSDR